MTKLSKWLKGNLKDNIKETFEATIEHLLKLNPPIKKGNKRQALISSLQALMKNDESVHEEYKSLNDISYGAGSAQTQNSNNIMSKHEVSTDIKEAQEINSLNGQKFSFLVSKQGSYVEPILEHVKKALFRFVVKNRDYIFSDTVKEFALKCNPHEILIFRIQTYYVLQSFKIEARNHYAYDITKSKGKWDDEKLQRLSTLALELVNCLGDENTFESLLMIKQNLSSELTEQYVLPMKRRHENNEDEIQKRKRHMTDKELRELIDFALNIVNKLEPENKEYLNQIV
ncbi:5296_t:CDS:2 [Dentiscutata heterogama]|uniref:5296_t:CDS:1 n=1 Tax=Dentiscutata heterogama TaxID=1316150 RepID=A0ACA9LGY9_9GLOM|nr:5296_t:CDS:2 [Dentiscutata heterogama]